MERNSDSFIHTITQRDWSLHRKGAVDQKRHNEKVKEAIKDNLPSIVSDGSIISADPLTKKRIKVSLKSLELPKIKFKMGDEGIGTGEGEVGDVIDINSKGDPSATGNKGAGDSPGVEFYETEITIEELQELVFQDLGLPNLKPKQRADIESEKLMVDDIRKKRTPTNLDITRTLIENIRRNAEESGEAVIRDIRPEDYRIKTVRQEIRPENNAVIIAMTDSSGSMDDLKKYLVRSFCWWSVAFLRSQYPKVDLVFIVHDTEAYEVNEEQFFKRGESGGTLVSSANKLAIEIIQQKYPPSQNNLYPMHFSDGENWNWDNQTTLKAVQELLEMDVNHYAYIQVGNDSEGLLPYYSNNIQNPRFTATSIKQKEDVFPALKLVFDPNKIIE